MSDPTPFTVRRAERRDALALGRLGAMLLRTHYAFDPQRFLAPGQSPERAYASFLESQRRDPEVGIFVAEMLTSGAIVGYVYAGIEPMSWKELRDECGFIHDVAVDVGARRLGVAAALMTAAIDWLKERGMPRVVLWTAEPNADAQRVFARLGFRRTMVEMTKEL